MREYSATVGASDGNIIAAIITTHTPRNQPSVPSAVQGPSSMPRIRCAVDHHPIAARAKRSAPRPARVREVDGAVVAPGEPIGRRDDHDAQENSDVDRPVLPSYSIPKAL